MAKTFDKDGEIEQLAHEVMRQHHPHLAEAGVTVEVLTAHAVDGDGYSVPALKKSGYPVAALVKITSLEDRTRGIADVKIVVDAYTWQRTPEASRPALLDHELEHIKLALDAGGLMKLDDQGRPKLRMQPHDWELTGFFAVAERHREAAVEVRALRAFRFEQLELFGEVVA